MDATTTRTVNGRHRVFCTAPNCDHDVNDHDSFGCRECDCEQTCRGVEADAQEVEPAVPGMHCCGSQQPWQIIVAVVQQLWTTIATVFQAGWDVVVAVVTTAVALVLGLFESAGRYSGIGFTVPPVPSDDPAPTPAEEAPDA